MRKLTLTIASLLTVCVMSTFAQEYEGGRGLITLAGPSGMFINPTADTLPKELSTFQYAVFFPDNDTDVVGHGLMGGYGVTENIELGLVGNAVFVDNGTVDDEFVGAGPYARIRLLDEDATVPQVSVGGYTRFGDDEIENVGIFLAASKRFTLDSETIQSVVVHGGLLQEYFDDGDAPGADDNVTHPYVGVEVQLPTRLYLVGEVTLEDDDVDQTMPYAFGLQWRAAGIAMSLAGIEPGTDDGPSLYAGIGYGADF